MIKQYLIKKNSGPWIVVLHSPGPNITICKNIYSSLIKENYSVIVPELRGHDGSINTDISVELLIKDLNYIFIKEKVTNAIIIANCASSILAASFCKKFPKQVKHLILLSYPQLKYLKLRVYILISLGLILLFIKSASKKRKKYLDWTNINDISLYEYLKKVRTSMSFSSYLKTLKSLIFEKILIPDIQVSTLIILAKHDFLVSNKKIINDAKNKKNIKLIICEKSHIRDEEFDKKSLSIIINNLKKIVN